MNTYLSLQTSLTQSERDSQFFLSHSSLRSQRNHLKAPTWQTHAYDYILSSIGINLMYESTYLSPTLTQNLISVCIFQILQVLVSIKEQETLWLHVYQLQKRFAPKSTNVLNMITTVAHIRLLHYFYYIYVWFGDDSNLMFLYFKMRYNTLLRCPFKCVQY